MRDKPWSCRLGLATVLALLGSAGSGCWAPSVCEPPPPPPASCVHFAQTGSGELLMVITPACAIVDEEVDVRGDFTATHFVLHTNAQGGSEPSPPLSLLDDFVWLRWGARAGSCERTLCVRLSPGPGLECPAELAATE